MTAPKIRIVEFANSGRAPHFLPSFWQVQKSQHSEAHVWSEWKWRLPVKTKCIGEKSEQSDPKGCPKSDERKHCKKLILKIYLQK